MISPAETGTAFRRRVAELADDPAAPLTEQEASQLALEIGAAERHLVSLVTALHRAMDPVVVGLTEVLVDLGRQLAPQPAIEHPPASRPEPLPRPLRRKARRRNR